MRFLVPIVSLLASVAVAQSTQCNVNCILVPATGLQVRAGQTFTLTWSNPSAGQITIKLQTGSNITPSSGITLATNVDAQTGKYTVTIPSDLPASSQYTFETVDQSNSANINFSPMFSIAGATGVSSVVTMTSSVASSRSSSASASSSSSASSASSSSSASSASSASSSSSSASRTSSDSSTRTSASATASITTSAPNSAKNGATGLKAEGALVAMLALAIAAF